MSGAALLYWRRKQEQWATLAERARRGHRQLPPRRVRPDRPRHRRPRASPARRRAARRRPATGPAPPAGLLHPGMEHRLPRRRPRPAAKRFRTGTTRTSRPGRNHAARLMGTDSGRTGPAIAARRQRTASMLARVEDAVTRLRLDGTPVTVRALAEHACVSATVLYGNPRARVLLSSARAAAARRDTGRSAAAAGQADASWRERALNAEDALSHAHTEILTQRRLIGELAGTIRDLETPLSTAPRSASPRRTPPCTTASASSPTSTAHCANASTPPAPPPVSWTGASPTSKHRSPSTSFRPPDQTTRWRSVADGDSSTGALHAVSADLYARPLSRLGPDWRSE